MAKMNAKTAPTVDRERRDAEGNSYWPDEDVRTLIRADQIRRDPKRMADARAAAKAKLEEKQKDVERMRSLANGGKQ